MDSAERLVLTAFCEELPMLRTEIAQHDDAKRTQLSRIEQEAAARRPILHLLGQLLGTDGVTTLRSLSVGLPGAGPGQADGERFGCPDGRCDRVAATAPAGPVPRCQVTGAAMKRLQI
ncbi:hypothetical protein LCL61_28435 [Amycolatopsis coloradensis]|uniref:Uncharacterized protein n=1 Tax=Amycolatopsis coloradensis TaxID=76021 RepID=A0ACD5BJN4_9PSEU